MWLDAQIDAILDHFPDLSRKEAEVRARNIYSVEAEEKALNKKNMQQHTTKQNQQTHEARGEAEAPVDAAASSRTSAPGRCPVAAAESAAPRRCGRRSRLSDKAPKASNRKHCLTSGGL